MSDFSVSVNQSPGVATSVIGENNSRQKLTLTNTSPSCVIYLNSGGTAKLGTGVRLNPNGGQWSTTSPNAITALASTAVDGTGASLAGDEV